MCWKLVRDRVGEELARRGVTVWRARSEEEYRVALVDKVFEEAVELAEAVAHGESSRVLEEAGDLLEAVLALLKLHGYSLEDLVEAMEAKRRERGGFDERLIALVGCNEGGEVEGSDRGVV